MSTVIFEGSSVPEKHLIKVHKYKAYLSQEEKEEIIDQIAQDIQNIDDYQISMHVEIELKLYNKPR